MFSQLTRYASELDIPIYDANLDIRATYDQRGKLRMDDHPSTCEGLSYEFSIDSPASPERIREMLRRIDFGCHAINTIRDPVPVSARVKLNGQELEL